MRIGEVEGFMDPGDISVCVRAMMRVLVGGDCDCNPNSGGRSSCGRPAWKVRARAGTDEGGLLKSSSGKRPWGGIQNGDILR